MLTKEYSPKARTVTISGPCPQAGDNKGNQTTTNLGQMKIRSYIRKTSLKMIALVMGMLTVCSCNNVIYDEEGDCSVTYKVRFKYDYNMKFADAFAHEVNTVTLYLMDKDGNIVWQRTEEGETLAEEGYTMTVDVAPGQYDLLAWAGTADKGSFEFGKGTKGTDLDCKLLYDHNAEGKAYKDKDLDRLFHGSLDAQNFPETEGTYIYTVPLIKNTNNIRIVLQNLSGNTLNADDFTFAITDDNGLMDWDNTVLDNETITYTEWYKEAVQTDFEYDGGDQISQSKVRYSGVFAELTIPRMMTSHKPRLTITNNDTHETVFSIPLIDYVLLVKGYENRNMDNQEYLDRQDVYDMVFFLDKDNCWIDTHIYINSWKVVVSHIHL